MHEIFTKIFTYSEEGLEVGSKKVLVKIRLVLTLTFTLFVYNGPTTHSLSLILSVSPLLSSLYKR